jgi:hypothetical protein
LLGRLKATIPNLQIYSPKKAISEKLGLGIDNPCMIVFLSLRTNKCLERVNDRHYWNPGALSYVMIPRCHPNSRVIFFIITSIVYVLTSISHKVPVFYIMKSMAEPRDHFEVLMTISNLDCN